MKLAIVGSGMIVHDFLTITEDLTKTELKAIVGTESSVSEMKKLQKQYKIEEVYTDFELCLTQKSIDTVYIAVPNYLHYSFAKKALEAGKNVICEKPFTLKLAELIELKKIANEKKLILIEAITNQYLKNYSEIKDNLNELGTLKIVECNYSQYSSRYDAFKSGEVLPAFNPKLGGGALMDINIYNIHFVVGLFGAPNEVHYYANIEKGIDTSGMLLLEYDGFKVNCIGSKDTKATIRSTIQGDKGTIVVYGPTNSIESYEIESENLSKKSAHTTTEHRMYQEFLKFQEVIDSHDIEFSDKMLQHSEEVMKIVDLALKDAQIKLG